jgi:hypothetical protein
MSPPHDQDAPVAPNPHLKFDNDPPPGGGVIEIPLSTAVNGNTISIEGDGNATLAKDRGATSFKFTLTDTSGGQVQFASLDTADNITTCPPTGSGNKSSQIGGIGMNNNQSPAKAHFTDNNSNLASNGPMNVSYQWNFTCSASFTVLPFDPMITNGGKTGPIL